MHEPLAPARTSRGGTLSRQRRSGSIFPYHYPLFDGAPIVASRVAVARGRASLFPTPSLKHRKMHSVVEPEYQPRVVGPVFLVEHVHRREHDPEFDGQFGSLITAMIQ